MDYKTCNRCKTLIPGRAIMFKPLDEPVPIMLCESCAEKLKDEKMNKAQELLDKAIKTLPNDIDGALEFSEKAEEYLQEAFDLWLRLTTPGGEEL